MNKKFNVSSYGTNTLISIPGPTGANNYDFGTTYAEIVANLKEQNHPYYTERGILEMMERDATIKEKPEKFSSTFDPKSRRYFDVIFTYSRTIMDKVISEFHSHGSSSFELCTVINIETVDDHQNALVGAHRTLEIAKKLHANKDDLIQVIDSLMDKFVNEDQLPLSYHVVAY
ncbi:RNA polymerase II subunit A C-terminal domain phosphatase SSU72 [Histomonas meleagridis]|uniref:RNA polymerase II subunit A C-terminal domain phosphatase SSU72 n=1 Tax=Histomonas meleagridis TaxID=135588 RepID=UPI00355984EF|nr:RNA polymerase II subunit A C-terminal domain phosphatase SSU72 [Histomonas meleagridis]KAH0801378.1 RNA polymerase II subunit A C-terminal domain phosphatase SSU72 [Histomonas meleagridis]